MYKIQIALIYIYFLVLRDWGYVVNFYYLVISKFSQLGAWWDAWRQWRYIGAV